MKRQLFLACMMGCFLLWGVLGCEAFEDNDIEDFDQLDVHERAAAIATVYQAESFTKQKGCAVATKHPGYTGSGFVDYGGNGTWIEWNNVSTEKSGDYTLTFRYAVAKGSRRCALVVNGVNVGNIAFNATGSWRTWNESTLTATLRAGRNTIRVLANTGSGGPNLDKMEVLIAGSDDTGQQLTLEPVADAYVNAASSGSNYGSAGELLVDTYPDYMKAFLKFSVPTLTQAVQSAKLRLYVTNGSSDGPKVYNTSSSWSENDITWRHCPAHTGSVIADAGAVSKGWLELDVTSALSVSGAVSFLLLPDSTDGVDFHSREGANPPELVIVTGGQSGPGGDSEVGCVLNPYSGVNWSTWKQYKANYHTHTTNSDGSDSPSTVVNQYYNADYDILSITDHNKTTWPWPTEPSRLGMLGVRGNEYSNSEHMNAFFDFTMTSTNLQTGIPHVKSQGGLCQINHPGRTHAPSQWAWFIPWFRDYTCFGLEVYNQGDRYPNDRKLWDNINENYFKTNGKLVWGTSNDDKHTTAHLYRNFQFMLMPSLTESDLKRSMKDGAFYFAYEPTGSGQAKVPRISNIVVDNAAKTIKITATGAQTIYWIGPGTTTVATGPTFDFAHYTKPFVRAVLDGASGDSFTQPFGFGRLPLSD